MPIEILYGVGVLLVAAAIAYGASRGWRRNRANDPVREEATRQLYEEPEAYAQGGRQRLEKELKPEG